jgi:ribose 1,5-bisphosphokinase PhnN
MKLPLLFRRDRTLAKADAQDQAEKLLAESLRTLGQVCSKVADFIEAQRLERRGYSQQNDFLHRLDRSQQEPGPKKD